MAPWIVLTFLVVHLVSLSASVLSYEVVEVQNVARSLVASCS